jgi:hypothetical protein
MSLHQLNPVEPPWYGPVCPVVGEGWHREVSPYPDLRRISPFAECPDQVRLVNRLPTLDLGGGATLLAP